MFTEGEVKSPCFLQVWWALQYINCLPSKNNIEDLQARGTTWRQFKVKALQGDFQQLQRDMFLQKCVSFCSAFEVWLLISFIFNFKFMFCTCIIVVDLIFVNFRFYSFCSDRESHAHLQLKWGIKLTVGCTVKVFSYRKS
jgi:hypothetical protein